MWWALSLCRVLYGLSSFHPRTIAKATYHGHFMKKQTQGQKGTTTHLVSCKWKIHSSSFLVLHLLWRYFSKFPYNIPSPKILSLPRRRQKANFFVLHLPVQVSWYLLLKFLFVSPMDKLLHRRAGQGCPIASSLVTTHMASMKHGNLIPWCLLEWLRQKTQIQSFGFCFFFFFLFQLPAPVWGHWDLSLSLSS